MKKIVLLLSAIVVLTMGCKKHEPVSEKPTTPAALEDNSSKLDVVKSYTRGGNLIESMYEELVEKDTSLQKIEQKIRELNEAQSIVSGKCLAYAGKSSNYYQVANQMLNELSDSTLKEKILTQIAASQQKYNTQTTELDHLIKKMDTTAYTVKDYHNILKVMKTLPLIESYQKEKLPDTKPITTIIDQQQKLIKTLSNKH